MPSAEQLANTIQGALSDDYDPAVDGRSYVVTRPERNDYAEVRLSMLDGEFWRIKIERER